MPTALRTLPDDAEVTCVFAAGGGFGCPACGLVADIEKRIELQAQGKFTVAEVAAILATENDADAGRLVERMARAVQDGELTARDPETNWAPILQSAALMTSVQQVTPGDVYEMLEKWGVSYRFAWPRPWHELVPVSTVVTASPDMAPKPDTGRAQEHSASDPDDMARTGATWNLRKPSRWPGYRRRLYEILRDAHNRGQPCPTSHDVMGAWRRNSPLPVFEVTDEELKYYAANGSVRVAGLDAIRRVIDRLTK